MPDAMNDDQRREKVRQMVKDISVCMFTTQDAAGIMHARPMAPMADPTPDDDTIWFFTHASTPKTDEMSADGNVLLSFSSPATQDFLSLTGKALVMRDVEKQKALWSEGARVWFPKGPESEDLALIAFHPEQAQYWDSPSTAMLYAYGYVKAVLTGEPPKGGENAKVSF